MKDLISPLSVHVSHLGRKNDANTITVVSLTFLSQRSNVSITGSFCDYTDLFRACDVEVSSGSGSNLNWGSSH